jgi:hypothetical protein
MLRRISGAQEDGENYIIRSFVTCEHALHDLLLGRLN